MIYLKNYFYVYYFFSHYISLPQLAFDMMLKITGVTIELLTDITKILFVEQNIRGGFSFISKRHESIEIHNGKKEMLYIDGTYVFLYF